jgi:hypothetical protein
MTRLSSVSSTDEARHRRIIQSLTSAHDVQICDR